MSPIPMPSRHLLRLAGAGLVSACLFGCSLEPRVLARVGDRTISVADYQQMAEGAAGRYFLAPDSARELLLDDLIRRELMLVAATHSRAVSDSFVARRRTEFENDALTRALIAQLTPRDVAVSDAEVRRLYLWRQRATHCLISITSDSMTAVHARQAIDAGQDFAAVAKHFDVTGTLPPGGDLGFVEAGQLVSPLDRIVRESPIGGVVGPVEAPGLGWFIIKIVAREAREHGPLEQQAPELRSMLQQRKQRIVLLARYAALRNEYQIRPDADGIDLMYRRLNAAQQLHAFGADPGATQFTPRERATIVGRWDGGSRFKGRLTLGEAMDDLTSGRGGRLQSLRLNTYFDWVGNAILQRVAVIEARRRHLDEEPATVERIRRSVEQMLLQAVYQTEVLSKAEPNDEEVRMTYEQNAPSLAQLKSVGVQYVSLPDSALAVRTAERAMGSGTLAGATAEPGVGVREVTVKFPTEDPVWKMLEPALARQTIRGILGPIHATDGWRVVQIVARDAPVPAFDQLAQPVQDGLRQQARELAAERQLKAFTDSLRAVTPVTVDRKLLERIPWPTPGGLSTMPGLPGS